MAATSLYALLALFTYDRVKSYSEREKTRELRNYAQKEVDPQIFTIIITISKIIYTKGKYTNSRELSNKLENLTKKEIVNELQNREYMGFDILCNSSEITKNIRNLLENNFIRPLLDDEMILLLLKLSNRLSDLYSNLSDTGHLIKLPKSAEAEYVIFGSKEISSYNAYYPDRKLLAKKIPKRDGMAIVERFADFSPRIDEKMLLNFYKIEENSIQKIADILLEILYLTKAWIKSR